MMILAIGLPIAIAVGIALIAWALVAGGSDHEDD